MYDSLDIDLNDRPYRFSLRKLLLLFVVISAVLCLIVKLPFILSALYHAWETGEQFDNRVFQAAAFELRVNAYHDRGAMRATPGGFYEYEVRRNHDWYWHEIAFFRLGCPDMIPGDVLHEVTSEVAYFFHGYMFGVTTDGGVTWPVKGGEHGALYSGQLSQYAEIEHVEIQPDGSGTMRVSNWDQITRKMLESLTLTTSDFGLSWEKKR